MKILYRTKKIGDLIIPFNINIANAVHGFYEMGAFVDSYSADEFEDVMNYITKDDIILDGIYQSRRVFNKFGVSVPDFDYPEEMQQFLGRKTWKDRISHIASDQSTWGNFVKPVKGKAFTGRVINGLRDLAGCGSIHEDFEVICTEPLDIKAEYRCFIRYDNIIDIRPYGSNEERYKFTYNYNTVEEMLKAFKNWKDRPMGCSMDICVTSDNKTLLLEMNDGYALGCYGLNAIDYAKLISARWSQLLNRKDAFLF